MQSRNKKEGGEMFREKGQSILEYVIVLTAIVGVIVAGAVMFAKPEDKTKGVGKLMDSAGETIKAATGKIANVGVR